MGGTTRMAMQTGLESDCWRESGSLLPLAGTTATVPMPDGELSPRRRMTRLVAALEAEIIPRLVHMHVAGEPQLPLVLDPPVVTDAATDETVQRLADLSYAPDDAGLGLAVQALVDEGRAIDRVLIDALGPAARRLGVMWELDRCSFTDVTVGLGRLQRVMRELSAAFDSGVEAPPGARRVLLLPAPGEQHTFGVSMVAEFFRHDGWDVVLDIGRDMIDPLECLKNEWFDVVGFSVGHDARLDWLRRCITGVRECSRNDRVRVLVGGPLFALHPQYVAAVGADATASDGREAPALAASLLVMPT